MTFSHSSVLIAEERTELHFFTSRYCVYWIRKKSLFISNSEFRFNYKAKLPIMTYDIFQHKHNFSVWAAARAAQRRFTNVETLKEALEQCGVVEFLKDPSALTTDKEEFDALHRTWCRNIVDWLVEKGVREVTFGRAAKLIAVYLKSMVIIGADAYCKLAQIVHPPVDRILLRNLSRSPEIRSPHKRAWRHINWSQLDEDEYYMLMSQLASCLGNGEPMWSLERYWTVIDDRPLQTPRSKECVKLRD